MSVGYTIRPWSTEDSISGITALLHAAYAPLAAVGMRYVASHQDDTITRDRLTRGFPFVAMGDDGSLAGTITLYAQNTGSACAWYRRHGVFHFGQFAVRPGMQRGGIGSALLESVEREARWRGAEQLACDTAESAEHLIRWYNRLGFRLVEHVSWPDTNYRSVVLSKSLPHTPSPP
jgi:GNAT superfamily N-acetyltransferase